MKKILLVLGTVGLLVGCSNATKEKMGFVKKAPDEFMIVSRAPLTLPPDYDLKPLNENTKTSIEQKEQKFQGLSGGERKLMIVVDAQETSDSIERMADQ